MSTGAEPRQLPYGGDVDDFRRQVAKLGGRGEQLFVDMLANIEGPFTTEQTQLNLMAHGASFHGCALVAVLGWLARKHGPDIAYGAACVAQNIAMNGDDEGWAADVWPVLDESAGVTA